MSKKKLFALSVVVIMIAILSFSSLAWFTDADEVKNEFMVAGSDSGKPDDIFSVDVWEDIDGDGEKDTTEGHTYPAILPGDHLTKVVKIENTGSYDQYIRVKVEISDAAVWQEVLGENFNDDALLACFEGYVDNLWRREETGVKNDVIYISMYYNGGTKENRGIVKPDDVVEVFTAVNIPQQLTQKQAAAFGADGFQIKVTAEAVQTKNMDVNYEDTVCDAYEAFRTAGMAN